MVAQLDSIIYIGNTGRIFVFKPTVLGNIEIVLNQWFGECHLEFILIVRKNN